MSPTLADKLVDYETDTVGTVRAMRKDVPAKIKDTKLKKGKIVAIHRKKSVLLKWKDKKDVCVLSTLCDDSMVNVKSRHGNEKTKSSGILQFEHRWC